MNKNQELTNLEQLLDRIDEAANDREYVSLDAILQAVGRRSFGPVLLVAGLVMFAPIIGDIPGVPMIMGVLVVLTIGQLLFRREHFWLPRWLLKRSVAQDKLRKALRWLCPPARFVDRLVRPRLPMFTHGTGMYVMAIVCIVIAAATPAMELVPFSANGAGAALIAFGLSLVAHDGLLALLAFLFTAGTLGLVVYNLI
jgi:hypothetical protein